MRNSITVCVALLCSMAWTAPGAVSAADFVPEAGVFYHIGSAKPSFLGMCVTDAGADADSPFRFTLSAVSAGDDSQLWSVEARGGALRFTNKATGRVIAASSRAAGAHNAVLPGAPDDASAWAADDLGHGQYALRAIEEDGVERWLCAAETAAAPDTLDPARLRGTGFAWAITPDGTPVGLGKAVTPGAPRVTVRDGVIRVSGAEGYTVTAADGARMPLGVRLPRGVYMVTAAGRTTKIEIK